jgi:hypothetical protein
VSEDLKHMAPNEVWVSQSVMPLYSLCFPFLEISSMTREQYNTFIAPWTSILEMSWWQSVPVNIHNLEERIISSID